MSRLGFPKVDFSRKGGRVRTKRALLTSVIAAISLLGAACGNSGDDADTAQQTREVVHARGTSQVPVHPQRIVTLEPLELDTAVALGIKPVGAAVAGNVTSIPAYLGVDGVTTVGTVTEPSIEQIAAVKPDLILGTESRHSRFYDRLNEIAPTVFIKTQADPWKDNARVIGDALNRKDDVSALLAKYDERCATIKQANAAKVTGKTVQMIRPRGEGQVSLYGPQSFAGSALECVGFTIPPQDWKDGLQADLSLEFLSTAAADYVFVPSTKPGDANSIPAQIRDNQAWFPKVTVVDTAYWVSGVGPKGGQKVLDDIDAFLASLP